MLLYRCAWRTVWALLRPSTASTATRNCARDAARHTDDGGTADTSWRTLDRSWNVIWRHSAPATATSTRTSVSSSTATGRRSTKKMYVCMYENLCSRSSLQPKLSRKRYGIVYHRLLSIFPHYHLSEILYTKLISVYIRNISWSQLCCLVLYTL